MEVVDYILDGLEAALELERELGVRTVELGPDGRKLLLGEPSRNAAHPLDRTSVPSVPRPPSPTVGRDNRADKVDRVGQAVGVGSAGSGTNQTVRQSSNQTISELVFLHDRPLSPKGVEMMAKILNALGKPDAPIVVTPPVPKAKVTVVLGGLALKKYFTEMRGEPGQWQKTPEGGDVLITYSPEYILRFGAVTPAVEKIKKAMWTSLKAVRQRLVV